ncbi:hypothetical protein MKW98_012830 [Papaver atlanticum]|uniref:RING-type domain-containing protein n=1 Tax=Papaver atlanticum TaxID=357466 RepID=A0AAD4SL29_9MAGN|nr:hypothetical protein MKW98_012830 [Papaver atlanticum]
MNNAFFTCQICTEEVPLQQRFKNKQQTLTNLKKKNKKRRSSIASTSSPPCAHPFCTNCIARYIEVKIEENEKPDIICPDTNCVNVLDPLSCSSFLPPKVFVRWCDYLCQSTICESYDTTYCPNPYCSELTMVNREQTDGIRMPTFKSRRVKRANEVLFMQIAAKSKWKRCPCCRIYVERTEGCEHITCR